MQDTVIYNYLASSTTTNTFAPIYRCQEDKGCRQPMEDRWRFVNAAAKLKSGALSSGLTTTFLCHSGGLLY